MNRLVARGLYKGARPGSLGLLTVGTVSQRSSVIGISPPRLTKTRLFHLSPQRAIKMSGADAYLKAVKARRTYYQLDASSTISDERIQEIVNEAMLHTPSSFNSQSTRALVLVGDEHTKLWKDIVKPAVKAVAPAESWEQSEKRLSGFQNAYGSVGHSLKFPGNTR